LVHYAADAETDPLPLSPTCWATPAQDRKGRFQRLSDALYIGLAEYPRGRPMVAQKIRDRARQHVRDEVMLAVWASVGSPVKENRN